MVEEANLNYATKIQELETRLEETEQLIDAIKRGEVDAFAISRNNEPEIYTLETGDYAYRVLIEQFAEGAINVTEEGLIVYTNEYFCKLLNLSYEQVIGSSIFEFIHIDSAQEFDRLFKESLTGKSKGEIFLSDGVKIPVYISLTSLQPKLATVGIIITDLSDKKKSEQIILEYQKDLESKILNWFREMQTWRPSPT
jgi:PAS domain S-box-containing protein